MKCGARMSYSRADDAFVLFVLQICLICSTKFTSLFLTPQCVCAAAAASGGPVNSASIEKSIKSPTPIVVPGAGTP